MAFSFAECEKAHAAPYLKETEYAEYLFEGI